MARKYFVTSTPVTPADEDIPPCTAFWVSAEGTVVLRLTNDSADRDFGTIPAGTLVKGLAVKRFASGTTATVFALRGPSRA
jgi:hypothetical protein